MRINVRPRSRNRKPVSVNTGIGTRNIREILKSVDSFIYLVSDMAEKGQEKAEHTGKIKTPSGKSAMYGFSVKMGGAGIPQVERFGNIVRKTEEGPVMEEAREPFVDIFEEKDSLEVIVELPGIEKKDISYEIKDDVLTLKATSNGRKYTREVLLPCKVSLLKTVYKNGVLRLTLEKQSNKK
jgi:HSP20 family protein